MPLWCILRNNLKIEICQCVQLFIVLVCRQFCRFMTQLRRRTLTLCFLRCLMTLKMSLMRILSRLCAWSKTKNHWWNITVARTCNGFSQIIQKNYEKFIGSNMWFFKLSRSLSLSGSHNSPGWFHRVCDYSSYYERRGSRQKWWVTPQSISLIFNFSPCRNP